jgi:hypothetical protein
VRLFNLIFDITIWYNGEVKSSMKKQKLILIVVLSLFLYLPHFASAAGLVPCGGTDEKPCDIQDLFIMLARVTNWLLMLAGVYATYVIIGAGFWLAISNGDEEKITQKKGAISNAVVGLVLAMMAFLFINTVTNWLLRSKCKIDLRSPLSYLTIQNYETCDGHSRVNEFK